MEMSSDLIDLLEEFARANVEYLLVGGQALALHGLPRFTKDLDIWVHDTPVNLQRLVTALRAFGAPNETIDGIMNAHGLDVAWMGTPPARVDLMKNVPGGDFERAWSSRVTVNIHDCAVFVVARAELVRLKRASGRPQDLVDAERLER